MVLRTHRLTPRQQPSCWNGDGIMLECVFVCVHYCLKKIWVWKPFYVKTGKNHTTTESQNGWGWLCPSGPAQAPAGIPRAGCLGLHPVGFWRSPGGIPRPLWAACASASSLYSTAVLPGFKGNLLCSSLHPLPLVLARGTTEMSLAQFSLYPPFRYLPKE